MSESAASTPRKKRMSAVVLVSSDSLTPRAFIATFCFVAGAILCAIGSSMTWFIYTGQQVVDYQSWMVTKDLGTVKGWLGSAVFSGCEW
jgi:hypothetical protein